MGIGDLSALAALEVITTLSTHEEGNHLFSCGNQVPLGSTIMGEIGGSVHPSTDSCGIGIKVQATSATTNDPFIGRIWHTALKALSQEEGQEIHAGKSHAETVHLLVNTNDLCSPLK